MYMPNLHYLTAGCNNVGIKVVRVYTEKFPD